MIAAEQPRAFQKKPPLNLKTAMGMTADYAD